MFLLHLTADTESGRLAARGLAHYRQLYQRLLGWSVSAQTYQLGPLTLDVLIADNQAVPVVVTSERWSVALLGNPSALASCAPCCARRSKR